MVSFLNHVVSIRYKRGLRCGAVYYPLYANTYSDINTNQHLKVRQTMTKAINQIRKKSIQTLTQPINRGIGTKSESDHDGGDGAKESKLYYDMSTISMGGGCTMYRIMCTVYDAVICFD